MNAIISMKTLKHPVLIPPQSWNDFAIIKDWICLIINTLKPWFMCFAGLSFFFSSGDEYYMSFCLKRAYPITRLLPLCPKCSRSRPSISDTFTMTHFRETAAHLPSAGRLTCLQPVGSPAFSRSAHLPSAGRLTFSGPSNLIGGGSVTW